VHPDIYRDLARQHHDDLDREAARAGLAAILQHQRAEGPALTRPVPLRASGHVASLWTCFRLSVLARTDRLLLAMEGRVARALANMSAPGNTP
jgi:hypothetical protein